jgi:hypothetical protein
MMPPWEARAAWRASAFRARPRGCKTPSSRPCATCDRPAAKLRGWKSNVTNCLPGPRNRSPQQHGRATFGSPPVFARGVGRLANPAYRPTPSTNHGRATFGSPPAFVWHGPARQSGLLGKRATTTEMDCRSAWDPPCPLRPSYLGGLAHRGKGSHTPSEVMPRGGADAEVLGVQAVKGLTWTSPGNEVKAGPRREPLAIPQAGLSASPAARCRSTCPGSPIRPPPHAPHHRPGRATFASPPAFAWRGPARAFASPPQCRARIGFLFSLRGARMPGETRCQV